MDLGLNDKKSPWWLWVIIGLVVVIVGLGSYVYGKTGGLTLSNIKTAFSKEKAKTEDTSKATTQADGTVTSAIPADWKTYTNTEIGFSFRYPKEWSDVKLNVVTDKMIGDGPNYTYISSSAGAGNYAYFDTDKAFQFDAWPSSITAPFNISIANKAKVNPDWTVSEFKAQSGISNGANVLLTKKLSDKSLLVSTYASLECSPAMTLQVITPLNTTYPNFQMNIDTSSLENDPIIKNAKDGCDKLTEYQQVAGKIKAGTYSDTIETNIKTAQMIADSLVVDETLTWKTYNNSTYGFSLKHPTDWTAGNIANDISSISIRSNSVNYSLGITITNSQSNLADYIAHKKTEAAELTKENRPGDTFGTQTNTTIGGEPAIKITNCTEGASAYKYDWYYVKKGSSIFRISITKVVGEGTVFDTAPYIVKAEGMLSTLQFTK